MGCAAKREPKLLERTIASHGVAGGDGSTSGTARFEVLMPGRLVHVTIACFARGTGGKLVPAAYSYTGETWTITALTGKGDVLNAMFTARQLPDSWELETGIRSARGTVALAAQAAGVLAEVIVQAMFEPADAAISDEALDQLYARCALEIGGSGAVLVLGDSE